MRSSDGKTEKSGGRLMYIETSSSRSDSVKLTVMRKSIRIGGQRDQEHGEDAQDARAQREVGCSAGA